MRSHLRGAVCMALALGGCDGCNRALPIEESPDPSRDLTVAGEADLAAADLAPADLAADLAAADLAAADLTSPPDGLADAGRGCAQPLCCTGILDCNPNGPWTMVCVAPGEWASCGICSNGLPCQKPSDCDGGASPGAGWVCDTLYGYRYHSCNCSGGPICLPGCTGDGDCIGGFFCDAASHRCLEISCMTNGDCPVNFQCQWTCRRMGCLSDAQCPDGVCVNNYCYESYGTCQPAP